MGGFRACGTCKKKVGAKIDVLDDEIWEDIVQTLLDKLDSAPNTISYWAWELKCPDDRCDFWNHDVNPNKKMPQPCWPCMNEFLHVFYEKHPDAPHYEEEPWLKFLIKNGYLQEMVKQVQKNYPCCDSDCYLSQSNLPCPSTSVKSAQGDLQEN